MLCPIGLWWISRSYGKSMTYLSDIYIFFMSMQFCIKFLGPMEDDNLFMRHLHYWYRNATMHETFTVSKTCPVQENALECGVFNRFNDKLMTFLRCSHMYNSAICFAFNGVAHFKKSKQLFECQYLLLLGDIWWTMF